MCSLNNKFIEELLCCDIDDDGKIMYFLSKIDNNELVRTCIKILLRNKTNFENVSDALEKYFVYKKSSSITHLAKFVAYMTKCPTHYDIDVIEENIDGETIYDFISASMPDSTRFSHVNSIESMRKEFDRMKCSISSEVQKFREALDALETHFPSQFTLDIMKCEAYFSIINTSKCEVDINEVEYTENFVNLNSENSPTDQDYSLFQTKHGYVMLDGSDFAACESEIPVEHTTKLLQSLLHKQSGSSCEENMLVGKTMEPGSSEKIEKKVSFNTDQSFVKSFPSVPSIPKPELEHTQFITPSVETSYKSSLPQKKTLPIFKSSESTFDRFSHANSICLSKDPPKKTSKTDTVERVKALKPEGAVDHQINENGWMDEIGTDEEASYRWGLMLSKEEKETVYSKRFINFMKVVSDNRKDERGLVNQKTKTSVKSTQVKECKEKISHNQIDSINQGLSFSTTSSVFNFNDGSIGFVVKKPSNYGKGAIDFDNIFKEQLDLHKCNYRLIECDKTPISEVKSFKDSEDKLVKFKELSFKDEKCNMIITGIQLVDGVSIYSDEFVEMTSNMSDDDLSKLTRELFYVIKYRWVMCVKFNKAGIIYNNNKFYSFMEMQTCADGSIVNDWMRPTAAKWAKRHEAIKAALTCIRIESAENKELMEEKLGMLVSTIPSVDKFEHYNLLTKRLIHFMDTLNSQYVDTNGNSSKRKK